MANPSDVNWLSSAMMQSGAAIVAIVGGMAVSRFVTTRRDFEQAKAIEESARAEFLRLTVEKDELGQAMAELRGEISAMDPDVFDEIARSVPIGYLRDVHLVRASKGITLVFVARCEKRIEIAANVQGVIRKLVADTDNLSPWSVVESKLKRKFVRGDPFMWKYVYLLEAEERRPPLGAPAPEQLPTLRGRLNNQVALRKQEMAERLASSTEMMKATSNSVKAARSAVTQAEAARIRVQNADDYDLIVKVLGYASGAMICFPLALLTLPVTGLPAEFRVLSAVPFLAGFAVMGRFLLAYAAYLRGSIESVPDSLLQLLGAPAGTIRSTWREQRTFDATLAPGFRGALTLLWRLLAPRALLWLPAVVGSAVIAAAVAQLT